MKNLFHERIGAINTNKFGSIMEVVKYINGTNITVKFVERGNLVKTRWNHFRDGKVKNPYDKTVHGIGYIGEGKYKPSLNSVETPQYIKWKSMIGRCYIKNLKNLRTYQDVSVCKEWLNFQNFAKWYDDNYYKVENETMQLDKDILTKGNKIYSPETCIFVPERINYLFLKTNSIRGKLPIGVIIVNTTKKYAAQTNDFDGITRRIGTYDTPENAFFAYKEAKENHIKLIANEYRDKIPEKLYNALITYQVEITD